MPVIVLLDIEPSDPGLWPTELGHSLGSPGCSRVRDALCLAAVDRPAAEVREKLESYTKRAAAGADEIWTKFPDYHLEFYVKIERMTVYGPERLEVRLGDVINGDRMTEDTLTLYDQTSLGGPPLNPTAKETISVSKADLGRFDFLMVARASQPESIKGKQL